MKYCRTKAATPEIAGAAIEVPDSETRELLHCLLISRLEPDDLVDLTSPGAHTSGLIRPSAVGPLSNERVVEGSGGADEIE